MARYGSAVSINCAALLMMLGVGMIVALLPTRIMSLSGSFSHVGWLAGTFALPFILLQVPVGSLADRFGFKVFLAAGYLLCCLAGLLYYVGDSPMLIFLGRMLQGMGECPAWSLGPAMLSVVHPAIKGRMTGFYNASIHLGLTGGSLLGLLTAHLWSGGGPFALYAGVSALGAMVVILFTQGPRPGMALSGGSAAHKRGSFKLLTKDGSNRAVLAGIALYGGGYGMLLTVVPAVLSREGDGGSVSAGLYFTLFYVALSLAQLLAGPLSDRRGRSMTMICGMLLAGVGLAFTPLEMHSPLRYGLLALASFGLGVFGVAAMAFLNDGVPASYRGVASGCFYFSWGTGYLAGPLILGKMTDQGRFDLSLLAFSVILLGEAVLLLRTARTRESRLIAAARAAVER